MSIALPQIFSVNKRGNRLASEDDPFHAPLEEVFASFIGTLTRNQQMTFNSNVELLKRNRFDGTASRPASRPKIIAAFSKVRELDYSPNLKEGMYTTAQGTTIPGSLPVPTGMPTSLIYQYFNAMDMSDQQMNDMQYGPMVWDQIDISEVDFTVSLSDDNLVIIADLMKRYCTYISAPFAKLANARELSDHDIMGRAVMFTIFHEFMSLFPDVFLMRLVQQGYRVGILISYYLFNVVQYNHSFSKPNPPQSWQNGRTI